MKKISLLLAICLVALTAFILPHSQQKEFEAFLSEIDDIAFPLQIQIEDLTRHYGEMEKLSNRAFDKKYRRMEAFRAFIPEAQARFSRMGPPLVEPLAKIEVSEEVVGVVYHTFQRNRFFGENAYRLMLYDRKGNPLDHQEVLQEKKKRFRPFEKPQIQSFVLAFHGVEETQIATLDQNWKISIQRFENNWEKDINEHGIMENEIIGYVSIDQQDMKLSLDGKIKEVPEGHIDKTARASIK